MGSRGLRMGMTNPSVGLDKCSMHVEAFLLKGCSFMLAHAALHMLKPAAHSLGHHGHTPV